MTDATPAVLEAWNARLSAALGVPVAEIERVLDLAGFAAHAVVRPAAPLSTFLAGYATALRVQSGADAVVAFGEVERIIRALAADDPGVSAE